MAIQKTKEDICNAVIAIVKSNFRDKKCQNLDQNSNIDHIGLDSLDQVEIVMELESEFDITIIDEDWDNLKDKTISGIADYIKRRIDADDNIKA